MPNRHYHGFALDPFQEQAIDAIDAGMSAIVAAPTGTGKTLVADYLIEQAIEKHLRAIYTAPIKALSNQKFKDFKAQFGEEMVGIMTGDIVLNPSAPLLIMTTEIFRNQVITEDPNLALVSYVIFDEIHWLNDEERGTVWEESIILAPKNIKLLGLSATIANARQLANWISSIREEPVVLIEEHKRIVPLEYYFYTKETGIVSHEKIWSYYHRELKDKIAKEKSFTTTSHLDLIKAIQAKYLPVLYFVFSRKKCAEKARELAGIANYLKPADKNLVEQAFLRQFGPEEEWSTSTRLLRRLCAKGIAFHHAGILPAQKVLVEELFQARLIHVLYCTETFSVGINYPVKSVCFDALNKYDGRNFRPLANHEFFQMSGRAGRRGIDDKGYSFALVDLNYMEKSPPPKFQINRLEPLESQFKLSYNTVLNLTATLNTEQIATYFQKSFAAYRYQQNTIEMKSQLAQISEELKPVQAQVCKHVGTYHCPLKYHPRKKELARLQKAYLALGPRKQSRVYGREIARRIRSWSKLLPPAPEACSVSRQAGCQEYSKEYFSLHQRYTELEAQLASLPNENNFLQEFAVKKSQLEKMGYLREATLLPRGECASRVYVQEILVTELIFSEIFEQLDDDQLNALLSTVDFEARKNDFFQKANVFDLSSVREIIDYVQGNCGPESIRYDSRVAVVTYAWSQGLPFEQVQHLSNLDEGDIISVFRRTIDLLRQMRDAVSDQTLRSRFKVCMDKLDRDEAALVEI